MGCLWNQLLSHSVAPMLIADIGGILPPPPKPPCPSAPNRPASTTIRSQDPNRRFQSLTGPGSGVGLPQRQPYTLGHRAPSEKQGAPKHWFGHCARACKGNVAQKPAQTQAHMHKTKTRRLVYSSYDARCVLFIESGRWVKCVYVNRPLFLTQESHLRTNPEKLRPPVFIYARHRH